MFVSLEHKILWHEHNLCKMMNLNFFMMLYTVC